MQMYTFTSIYFLSILASPSNVSGIVIHVKSQDNVSSVANGKVPYGPFVVLLATELFTRCRMLFTVIT